ncbi:MAG: ABC transporter substrate-binding protein [Candidatus Rokubacteria bacterium]|nr:ABC transporter substrate-binding protein [Candidatus Rokubacteria bacterium]
MSNAFAAWLFLAVAATAPGSSSTPREVVQSAVGRVVAVLEESSPTSLAGRDRTRAAIRRVAAELFDFDEMARRALSRHWAGRTRAEQAEFVELFTDLLERAYITRIEAYSGEKVVYSGEAVDGRYALVRSRLVTSRRSELGLDYRLHLVAGRWKVYDVLIDGVSFVSTYRSQFNRVIQSSSWADLLERLRRKRIEIRTAGERTQS